MSGAVVKLAIVSDARQALSSLQSVGKGAKGLGHDLDTAGKAVDGHSKRFGGLRNAGLAAGAGIGLLGGFIHGASEKFAEMVKETTKLQRTMGGSVESASRWAAIATASGVDTDVFGKSILSWKSTWPQMTRRSSRWGYRRATRTVNSSQWTC